MRFQSILRAGAVVLALVGAAAVNRPALAQSAGGDAGDATGVVPTLRIGTIPSIFPQTVVPIPQAGFSGASDRVRTRSHNAPNREGVTIIGLDDEEAMGTSTRCSASSTRARARRQASS